MMKSIIHLEQGSQAWHQHRAKHRNASETAAVMGVSPWQTPYELWLMKTGRKTQEESTVMRHGIEMEASARVAFEQAQSTVMRPQVIVSGAYSASLDGISLDGQIILEIKCPFRGVCSELWQNVKAGMVPEHYLLQVQHQLMVSEAELCYFWVYDGKSAVQAIIYPDFEIFKKIQDAWDSYQVYLDEDRPPPLQNEDTNLRDDEEWEIAASEYLKWKKLSDEALAKLDIAKSLLIKQTSHSRESGFGVSVTRYWKQGSIDYKSIPELNTLDLTNYRGKSREEVRVTITT